MNVCVREGIEILPGEEAGNFPNGDFLLVAFLILQQKMNNKGDK